MKARALALFRTKLRHNDPKATLVVEGQIIEGDAEHLRAVARNGLVEIIEDGKQPTKQPDAKDDGKGKKGKAAAKSDAAPKQPDAKDDGKGEGDDEPQAGEGQ